MRGSRRTDMRPRSGRPQSSLLLSRVPKSMSIQGSAVTQVQHPLELERTEVVKKSRLTSMAEKYISHVGTVDDNTLVLKGTSVQRNISPDKVNLDKQGLTNVPIFQGERPLRLLNLQNNQIRVISNLHLLTSLIFLDLYGNKIEQISGLESVPGLRILMLGRNQLTKISGLEALNDLDVLDLHSNAIEEIDGISHLRHLRLNLRRNSIRVVHGFGQLRALQRLYLSNNSLDTLDTLPAVCEAPQLLELTVDGNTVTELPDYVGTVLSRAPKLKQLDQIKITAKVRMDVRAQKLVQKPSRSVVSEHEDRRPKTRSAAQGEDAPPTPGREAKATASPTIKQTEKANGYALQDDSKTLVCRGAGVSALMGKMPVGFEGVSTVVLRNCPIPGDVTDSKLMHRVLALKLSDCPIHDLADLNPFTTLTRLTSLEVRNCPITTSALLFPYVSFVFPRLNMFNEKPVLTADRHHAASLFAGITNGLSNYTIAHMPPTPQAAALAPFIAAASGSKASSGKHSARGRRTEPPGKFTRPGLNGEKILDAAVQRATKQDVYLGEWPHLVMQIVAQTMGEVSTES
ncbi:Leucine rich repeat [Carpediemonas membranifera]|uniref:Leucine rich repeat n=1 Tax=Carpediemonas membranifera TaxID=201153 RepID=A0A8J6E3A9_9EUKA|nr:Leucine rich repeat [Carpediemonas membranifera]|eukprot:KAG9395381.1 Leucine rich repeat [Carpediemonas membranifera]